MPSLHTIRVNVAIAELILPAQAERSRRGKERTLAKEINRSEIYRYAQIPRLAQHPLKRRHYGKMYLS